MHPILRSKYLSAALVGILALLVTLTGCSRLALPEVFSKVIQPSIVPSTSQQGLQVVTRDFDFEGSRIQLSVPVDIAVYAGAQNAEKSTVFIGRPQPADWVGDYYRSFVDEVHQEEFFVALLKALHEVRQQQNLDSSRYVELVTSMAQSTEYRVDPGSLAPKFPIETFSDGYGDCDDKTLLAAAVLARDGYDVAILFFEPEKHVALGIRASDLEFQSTGYAYAEMTQPSLLGIPPESLADGQKLESQPTVIRIGDGTESFDAAGKVSYIQKRLKKLRAAAEKISAQIAANTKKLTSLKAELERAKQSAQAATDPASAAAAAQRYNRLVGEYNALVNTTNALVAQHNSLVEADRFAAEHQTSRPQIYEQLRSLKL